MNWAIYLLGVMGGLTIAGFIATLFVRQAWKEANKARREGFVAGMDIAVRNHAVWINDHIEGQYLNGFAIRCDKCDYTLSVIQPAEEEYHRCGKCGHRNPAPLAPERKVKHGS